MSKILLFDFSNTILFATDKYYSGSLNSLYKQHSDNQKYNFWDYFYLNQELLDYLKIHQNKFDCYILTTGKIQETKDVKEKIKNIFKRVFTVADIGIPKYDSKIYIYVAKQLNLNPSQILFIDDVLINIKASQKSGMNVFYYQNNNQKLFTKLNNQ